jgi:hypothetical protein
MGSCGYCGNSCDEDLNICEDCVTELCGKKSYVPQYCFECGEPGPREYFKYSMLNNDEQTICETCGIDFNICFFCKNIYDYRILHLMDDKINYICVYCVEERL